MARVVIGSGESRADERTRLVELLVRTRGNLSAVARELKTSRSHAQRLLSRYAIDLGEYRKTATDEGNGED